MLDIPIYINLVANNYHKYKLLFYYDCLGLHSDF